MELTVLQEISSDVTSIKWLIIGGLALIILFVVVIGIMLWGVVEAVKELTDRHQAQIFRHEAAEYLDKDQIDELLQFSRERLATHPNHTHANWYLAQAYYHQDRWVDAMHAFKKLVEISPDWRESVDPYLEELGVKIKASAPMLV